MNSISDFKRLGIKKKDKHKSSDHRNKYVPYIAIQQGQLPRANELINQETRFYLQPQSLEECVEQTVYSETRAELDAFDSKQQENNKEYKLDVGVTNLQRVIDQLRGLRSDGNVVFDPAVSRLAGVPAYCDYLHGNASPPRHRKPPGSRRK